jgi:hypothetical protein
VARRGHVDRGQLQHGIMMPLPLSEACFERDWARELGPRAGELREGRAGSPTRPRCWMASPLH